MSAPFCNDQYVRFIDPDWRDKLGHSYPGVYRVTGCVPDFRGRKAPLGYVVQIENGPCQFGAPNGLDPNLLELAPAPADETVSPDLNSTQPPIESPTTSDAQIRLARGRAVIRNHHSLNASHQVTDWEPGWYWTLDEMQDWNGPVPTQRDAENAIDLYLKETT